MSLERFTRKDVVVVLPEEPAAHAAEAMLEHHVGAVVVVEQGRPIGMVTDRDLALRLIAAGRDGSTSVREVMSGDLVTARVEDQVDDVAQRMRRHGVRRLPIVDANGALVGLVALDDLYVLLAGELSATARAVIENRGP
jgi:CBS domain-containing protein